ncbi:MAG: relaxase domain-containing protein [Deltaproteobacteria bacterium]|nr:relaxase domain-containing protein [Deltaproteobacteria bacterium]
MLSLSNVSANMAFSYFSRDDYYAPKENQVETFGELCNDLGIKGTISKREFGNLLEGLSPDGTFSLAKERTRTLERKYAEKAFASFKDSLEKTALSTSQKAFLLKEYASAFDGKDNKTWLKSLSVKGRKSVETITKICIKKWGISEKDKQAIARSISSFLKVIAPETRRAATDVTLSAPKSVSILGLVGGRKEILECHKKAVSYALQCIEKEYIGTRFTKGKQTIFEKTGRMIGAQFMHGTSREGDPQLHTHCVIFNLTRSKNGRWSSTNNDKIFRDSKLLGVFYQNKLAELVQAAGYEIEPKKNGCFEIKGYSEEQLSSFSKRRKQVLEEGARILYEKQKRDGITPIKSFEEEKKHLMKQVSQELARTSVYRGRKAKRELAQHDLEKKWSKEGEALSLTHPEKTYRSLWGTKLDLVSPLKHVSERKAVFRTKEIELQALVDNLGRSSFENIKSSLHNSREFVLANSERDLAANISQLRLERDLIRAIKNQASFAPIGTKKILENMAKNRQYSPGQMNALTLSVTSQDQFILWNGVAGAGKSYALGDLKRLAEKKKISVFALAPDGGSARELGKSIEAPSSTVQRFLTKRAEIREALLIVDEATKLSTRSMSELVNYAKETNSRIIFVGDRRQFTAVEAGNPFEALYQRISTVELTEHLRQDKHSAIEKAVKQASLQTNDSLKASSKILDSNIIERKSQLGRQSQFINSYLKLDSKAREETLLLVDLNHDRQSITQALRKALQKEGSLDRNEVLLPILRAKDLSEVQKKQGCSYAKGDILVSYGYSSSLQPGLPYEVVEIERDRLKLAANGKTIEQNLETFTGNVYHKENIQVAKGDTLEWRKNQGERLNRDALSVIKAASDTITVQDKKGNKIKLSTSSPQHLDYALVKTAYSAQGATADRVIALSASRSSMQSWYVTLSRARKGVKIITDDKEKLTKNILKSNKQKNALDESRREDLEKYIQKLADRPEKTLTISSQEMSRGIVMEHS